MSEEIIVKKGETILQARIQRSSRGLVVRAKTHSCIEKFFQERSKGLDPLAVNNWNRLWNKMPEYPDLKVYQEPDQLSVFNQILNVGDAFYTLNSPGGGLLIDPTSRGIKFNCVNMSFLRCQGISENLGVAFSIKGAFTEEEVRKIGTLVQTAAKRFYLDYLRPVDLQITMTTQEASYV